MSVSKNFKNGGLSPGHRATGPIYKFFIYRQAPGRRTGATGEACRPANGRQGLSPSAWATGGLLNVLLNGWAMIGAQGSALGMGTVARSTRPSSLPWQGSCIGTWAGGTCCSFLVLQLSQNSVVYLRAPRIQGDVDVFAPMLGNTKCSCCGFKCHQYLYVHSL